MNVKELKEMLNNYSDDVEIIHRRYSDFATTDEDDFELFNGVSQGFYVMRSHPTMSKENKAKEKKYLLLP